MFLNCTLSLLEYTTVTRTLATPEKVTTTKEVEGN